jgi:hypothetical protein
VGATAAKMAEGMVAGVAAPVAVAQAAAGGVGGPGAGTVGLLMWKTTWKRSTWGTTDGDRLEQHLSEDKVKILE